VILFVKLVVLKILTAQFQDTSVQTDSVVSLDVVPTMTVLPALSVIPNSVFQAVEPIPTVLFSQVLLVSDLSAR
jgi:hypothetical protein